ncbi:MAG TPA: HAD family phosphatase [Bacteroidia bacterium]|nr:HAD family phosphatase [Bacteroidia bacterium]
MTAYKALIFDLGKVIFDYSFDLAFSSWGKTGGLDREVVRKRFAFDETYGRFSKGEVTPQEYCAHVSELTGIPLSQEEFEQGWNSIYLDIFPGINQLLKSLLKKYRLVSLTNTNSVHAKAWSVLYEEQLALFERIFCSFEIGTRKPEKMAYNIVLEYLRLPAEETLMLDDKPGNIMGAAGAGIKGICVKSTSQMKSDLENLGIKF